MAQTQLKAGPNYAFLITSYNPEYVGKQGYCLQGCFGKGQLIITDTGSRVIDEIKVGDIVLSFNEITKKDEFRAVRQTFVHKNPKKTYEVILKNGKSIIATEDHKFYCEEAWIELRHLLRLKLFNIASFREIAIPVTYDISVEGNSNYYLDCGYPVLAHNSGGSGKTYDILYFILTYCRNNRGHGKRIFICRETYSACKDTVLADFIDILKSNNMYDKALHVESHPQKYYYEGNIISFGGRDNVSAHGKRNNLIYFNEILLDDNDKAYIQLNGRCKEIFICDYNPIYTDHWVYDKVKSRSDVKFFKTTFLTNKFLPEGERQEKLGYEPWHPEDRHLPTKKRRPHPTNIDNGTADEYLWKVYGEGEATAAVGVIFQYVTWVDEFPAGMDYIYTMDFGFTVDPCVINKYAEDESNIWVECLSYSPMETADDIDDYATAIGLNKKIQTVADSSDKYVSEEKGTIEMVSDLQDLVWNITKVRKTKSVMYWVNDMKKKKIHIVRNHFYKKVLIEKENYRMRTINGIAINQPVDKWNHFWDSTRYGHIFWNEEQRSAFW